MEDACKQLEIEFKKVCNDLDFVSHHLETKFRGGAGEGAVIPVDVISMIKRMRALELRMSSAREKVDAIVGERKVVFEELTSTLLINHKQLSDLSKNMNGFVNYTTQAASSFAETTDDNNNAPGGITITLNDYETAKISIVNAIRSSHFMPAAGHAILPFYNASSSSSTKKSSKSIAGGNLPCGAVVPASKKEIVTITKSVKFPSNGNDLTKMNANNENVPNPNPVVNFAADPRRLSLNPPLRAKAGSGGNGLQSSLVNRGKAMRRLSLAF